MRGRPLVHVVKEQGGFAFAKEVEGQAPAPPSDSSKAEVIFDDPDPSVIWVRNSPLERYLLTRGQSLALEIRRLVRQELDLTELTKGYKGGGKSPYHPAAIVGLVLYAIMLGLDSLRDFEALARRDAGAWWITGGVEPDHTTIAKLLNKHSAFLGDEFFVEATRKLCASLGVRAGTVAVDGTVIEAAASRFGLVKQEAAKLAAKDAAAASGAAPEDLRLREKAAQALEVERAVEERTNRAKDEDRDASRVCVAPSDPDAVVQPLKNGGPSRPSYKPSIMVDENKMIVGQLVHGSSETAALGPMLEQHQAILGELPAHALGDTGYFNNVALRITTEAGLDFLAPPDEKHRPTLSKSPLQDKEAGGASAKKPPPFSKGDFHFDQGEDAYTCPAGKKLSRMQAGQQHGLEFTKYGCTECGDCPFRRRCTTSAIGRTIKRYESDELKEQMVQIFRNPLARKVFRLRRVLVEPVFGDLKEKQGFKRLKRRGLLRVSMEFSLHMVAYNIKRALTLKAKRVVLSLLFACEPDEPSRLVGLAIAFTP